MWVRKGVAPVAVGPLLAAAAVTGCGVLDGDETGKPFGLELLVSESREIGEMDALVRGRMTDVGGCVGVADGKASHLVVWPRGTEATAEEIVVDGHAIGLGDRVKGAGGYLTRRPGYFPSIPTSCAEVAEDEVIRLDAVADVRP